MRHFAQNRRLDGIMTANNTNAVFFFSIVGETCIVKRGSTLTLGRLPGGRSKDHLPINPSTDLAADLAPSIAVNYGSTRVQESRPGAEPGMARSVYV